MNKEQKRYLKEIKALMPVYGKYEKRFFHDIKDSICELDAEHITYEMLCRKLGRPEGECKIFCVNRLDQPQNIQLE